MKSKILNIFFNVSFYVGFLLTYLYTLHNVWISFLCVGATGGAAIGLASVVTTLLYIVTFYFMGNFKKASTKLKSLFKKEAK